MRKVRKEIIRFHEHVVENREVCQEILEKSAATGY
jgi:hypothetical protein